MAKAAAAPPADDLVPVQLALDGTRQGAVQEWVLWPCAASKAEIRDFADTLVGDLGLQPQLKQPVTQAIVSQVNDWCSSVPPPAREPAPRRELIRLDLVLDGSLRLRDQFWWDLHSDALTPEDFAAELCADAGVEPRHGAAVAAAIRIELAKLRQAPPTNLPLPTPRIGEGQLPANGQQAQLQSVYASGCMRGPEQWQDWGPSLHHLTLEEAQALQQQQAAVQAQHQAAAQQAAVQAQQAAAQEQQQAAAQVQQAAHAQQLQLQQRAAELERLRAAAVQSQAGQPVEQQAPAVEQQAPAEPQLPQLVPQQAVGGMPPQGHTTVVVPSLPHNPLAGQGPRQQQLGMPQLVGVQQPPQQAVQAHALQAMQQQAAVQAAAQQEPEQQQQQQQPAGKQQGKKRGRGEAGGAAAPGRRQLRPRRASRLAQILREEEESGSGSDDGGHSRDASRRESGPAAAGGRGHQAAHSTGSGDYQPDEDALAAAAEEAEFAARDRKAPKSKAQHKAPRRASGGTAAAAAAAAAAAPAAATAPGTSPSSVAVRRQPVGPGPGLSTFQHHPPVPQPALLPVAAQQPALLPQMAGGSSMPPPMPSLGVMASTSGPGMGGGIVPTTIMLPGQASLGRGPVPMPLPPNPMGPRLESSASAGVAQQLQLVAAAIVHYARELGIGEPKIQSFLACPPDEQLKLYRTLHQLVIQARARQQQQLQAAVMAQQQQAQQQQQQQQMAPLPGLGLGPGPMGGVPPPPMGPPLPLPPMPAPLPPMPLEAVPQSAGPAGAGQYANLFSEMFD